MTTDMRPHNPLIIDELEARRLLVAIPLSKDGPLSQEERDRVMAALSGHLERYVLRSRHVSLGTGIAQSTISSLRGGKCALSDVKLDEHVRAINNWMEVDARTREAKMAARPLADSFVVLTIKTAADLCRKQQTMGYVTGPAGIGKTATAIELSRIEPGTVHMVINSFNRTRTSLLRALCERLGVGSNSRRGDLEGRNAMERLAVKLSEGDRLLIFDEADKLHPKSLETIRELHDAFKVPVLLLGVIDLGVMIQRTTSEDHGQMESRFGVKFDVRKLRTDDDGKERDLFTQQEVAAILTRPGLKLTAEAARVMTGIANVKGSGSIRACEFLLALAARAVRKRDRLDATEVATVTGEDLAWAISNSEGSQLESRIREFLPRRARSA